MTDLFTPDAEVAVLSILIKFPEKYYELRGLNKRMFSSTPYDAIFNAIVDLNNRDIQPSYTVLKSYIDSNSELKIYDELLNYLYGQSYSENELSFFEDLIIRSYKSRTLVSTSNTISKLAMSGDLDGATSSLANLVDTMSMSTSTGDAQDLGEIVPDAFSEIQKRVSDGGKIPGATTGFSNIDVVTGGYSPGDLWIVAGRSSMGKTAWLCNSALQATKNGVPFLIFSKEMTKKSLVERLLAIESGIDSSKIRFGNLTQKELDIILETSKGFKSLPLVVDANFVGDLNYTISTTKKLVKQKEIKVVALDYVQLLSGRGDDSTNEIGRITRAFKIMAGDLGITSILLSQLNRGVESREDKRPMLSDLRQSGNLEEDADVVMVLYRDDYYNKDSKNKGVLEQIFRKQRNGPIGTVFANFEPDTNRIKEH